MNSPMVLKMYMAISLSLVCLMITHGAEQPMNETTAAIGGRYYINGDQVSKEAFEDLRQQLVFDESSRRFFEKNTGGYSSCRVMHKNNTREGDYIEGVEDGLPVFKINLLPLDGNIKNDGLAAKSTWRTFTDPGNRYSFKYPSDWKVVALRMDESIVEVQPADTRDPYARLNSFRIMPLAEEVREKEPDSLSEWHGALGEGTNIRLTRSVRFPRRGIYIILCAQPDNIPVLESILASLKFSL